MPHKMKPAHAGLGAIVLLLVVTGVAGTVYKLVTPDGWVIGAFQRSTSAGLAVIGAIGLAGLFAWISRGAAVRGRNARAVFFVYAFAAAGFLYLARYWMLGSL
jgi:hypothetical protein